MVTIGNVYGHGFDRRQVSCLENLGVRIRPATSRYMGAQVCRFVDFATGPSLELIEVEDEGAYLAFLPEGMTAYSPGISLVPTGGPNETLGDYKRAFAHLRPYDLHVNYDGTAAPRGPGWNYLNFGLPVVAGTFLWLTEYDEPRPARPHAPVHPNGVQGVAGLVFDLPPKDLEQLARLAKRPLGRGRFDVGSVSVQVLDDDAIPELREKAFPLVAVVLQAPSLDQFDTSAPGVQPITWDSRPAIHIATNERSWDLVVTQAGAGANGADLLSRFM